MQTGLWFSVIQRAFGPHWIREHPSTHFRSPYAAVKQMSWEVQSPGFFYNYYYYLLNLLVYIFFKHVVYAYHRSYSFVVYILGLTIHIRVHIHIFRWRKPNSIHRSRWNRDLYRCDSGMKIRSDSFDPWYICTAFWNSRLGRQVVWCILRTDFLRNPHRRNILKN